MINLILKKASLFLFLFCCVQTLTQAQCVISISKTNIGPSCFSDSVLLTASPGFKSYVWSNGDTTRQVYASKGITYIVLGTTATNCIAVDSIVLQKAPKSNFEIVGSAQCDTSNYIFTNTTQLPFSNVAKFVWNYGDGNKYISGSPNSLSQDSIRWTQSYMHTYTKGDVFFPYLIAEEKGTGCIDTFRYENTGKKLPENIIIQIDILSRISISDDTNADSVCIANPQVTLYNNYSLEGKGGTSVSAVWRFNDPNANPPGSDVFINYFQPTYRYKKLGQFFPTLTIRCPGLPIKVRTYNYFTKIDTIPSSALFVPEAQNITSLHTANGKILNINDSLFLKRNIYNGNTLVDSVPSKWNLFNNTNADTLKRVKVGNLYGYGINVIGTNAKISDGFNRIGLEWWQQTQCGPVFAVQFTNASTTHLSGKLYQRWDFDDPFAPVCTSYAIPNPASSNAGKGPYANAADLQNRTLGKFKINGIDYNGRLSSCNFSHDSLPTKGFINWDVVYNWYLYGHDFPPYNNANWAVGYTAWPTTQSPPAGKNWVQPQDTIVGPTWGAWNKPLTASGTNAARIDTITKMWPADILPNKPIFIDKDIPDPIAGALGYWNYVIPAGHTITPNGTITPNDLGNLPNGQARNYSGATMLSNNPPFTLYQYAFNRIVIKDHTVRLMVQDSGAKAAAGTKTCSSMDSTTLFFTRPDAYGLGKDGNEAPGFRNGADGGNAELIFNNIGFSDADKTQKAPGIIPSNGRTFIMINYDSLLDRNDNTPCDLDAFVDWQGGTTLGGLTMPPLYNRPNYPNVPGGFWSSASGSRAVVHYFPVGPAPNGISNMPLDRRGYTTIGLIVGNGCASPVNCSMPSCISDTVWYHNFFRFVSLNPDFTFERNTKALGGSDTYCYLRKRGDTITCSYLDTIQDNVLADIWEWGDGTATIDSFYYTGTNKDVPTGRKRFEFDNSNSINWRLISSFSYPLGTPTTDITIDTIYACDDPLRSFPPVRIDTRIRNSNSAFTFKPIAHVYYKTSFEMLYNEWWNGGSFQRFNDITNIRHTMITNIGGKVEHRSNKYITIGVIDTFMVSKENGDQDTIYCTGENIYFTDSIRYWYSGGTGACNRPFDYWENNYRNDDQNNRHQWAYTKDSYPKDSIYNALDLTDNLVYRGTNNVSICPVQTVGSVSTDIFGNQLVICSKIKSYFHERIYWDFESDGKIDNYGPNPVHQFNTAGRYKVTMISIDSIGAWDTCFRFVNIQKNSETNVLTDSTLLCSNGKSFIAVKGRYDNIIWKLNNVVQPSLNDLNIIPITKEGIYSFSAKVASNIGCGINDQTVVYKIPSQSIVGLKVLKENTTATYSVTNYPKHIYKWQLKGGTISTGQGSSSVSVLWGNADSNAWIKVSDSLENCVVRDSLAVIINKTIGVSELNTKSKFVVFPNPTSDKIFISPQYAMKGNFEIVVYGINGKILRTKQVKDIDTNISIDVAELTTGIYFIKINDNESQFVYKFVKQ